jgi:uncharacterized protein YdaU (DUF1376 family)
VKTDIWMPLYIGDYLADTMHLTTEQHGAYLLLIMAYWRRGKALPACDRKLAGIANLSLDAWSIAQAEIKEFFDTESDPTLWVHKRIEKEMRDAQDKKVKATEKARAAAGARWKGRKNSPDSPPSGDEF